MGCPSRLVVTHDELVSAFDEVLPTLRERAQPVLIDVRIEP